MKYKPTIGLEIHVELKTNSKMFCSSSNDPNEQHPNVNICPICMGHPGTLPVINEEAVKLVLKTGLALGCSIAEYSKFDRKNYFYPDLPKGYQISQYDMPLCERGFLKIGGDKVRITRIHLEEDTGRLIHPEGADYSLVDFNRAGVPLMELVTEPDIYSGKEARQFAEELRLILKYLGVSDADMEKGQLRVEANISVSKDPKKLGTKVEIKNLNSFRSVEKATEYEIDRQIKALTDGKKITQETRGWHDNKEITFSQRGKEEAHDYRYFPEPDLPIMRVGTEEYLKDIKAEIPELPQARRERFEKEYELSVDDIETFTTNKDLGEYFEKVISELRAWIESQGDEIGESDNKKLIQLTCNYIQTDLQALLKKALVEGEDFLITPENFAEFIVLIYRKIISSKIAKMVLAEMFSTGADPSHVIEDKNLSQISDESEIEKIIDKVIEANPQAVEDYGQGKEASAQFLVGQVMKETRGKANPGSVNRILKKKLSKS